MNLFVKALIHVFLILKYKSNIAPKNVNLTMSVLPGTKQAIVQVTNNLDVC
jgi:hypothetical protein